MLNYKVGILGSGTMGLQLSAFFSCYNIDVIVWNHKVNNNFHKNINLLEYMWYCYINMIKK